MSSVLEYDIKLLNSTVVCRPSKKNKSPYLLDINIKNNKIEMCHTPGLGLSGLIKPNTKIKVLPLSCDNKKRCSKYTIEKVLIVEKEIKSGKTWLGANPIRANTIFYNTIKKKLFKKLTDVEITNQEYTILDSRIDFKGKDLKGNNVFIEVKNVVVADYHVSTAPKDRKIFYSTIKKNKYKRVGVFPDGQSKPGSSLVSPRAFKHLLTLEKLSKKKNTRSILIFVLQRSDCNGFLPNYIKDPIYSNKLYDIYNNSKVEIYILSYKWIKDKLYFHKELKLIEKNNFYKYGKIKNNLKNK